ncbi:MAG: Immune inhibitor peptidase [Thermoplasmata archaeon]|jgi:hypothetical protein|nr:Immune inhibitor peptidase [Thermoplasmata archaeon]
MVVHRLSPLAAAFILAVSTLAAAPASALIVGPVGPIDPDLINVDCEDSAAVRAACNAVATLTEDPGEITVGCGDGYAGNACREALDTLEDPPAACEAVTFAICEAVARLLADDGGDPVGQCLHDLGFDTVVMPQPGTSIVNLDCSQLGETLASLYVILDNLAARGGATLNSCLALLGDGIANLESSGPPLVDCEGLGETARDTVQAAMDLVDREADDAMRTVEACVYGAPPPSAGAALCRSLYNTLVLYLAFAVQTGLQAANHQLECQGLDTVSITAPAPEGDPPATFGLPEECVTAHLLLTAVQEAVANVLRIAGDLAPSVSLCVAEVPGGPTTVTLDCRYVERVVRTVGDAEATVMLVVQQYLDDCQGRGAPPEGLPSCREQVENLQRIVDRNFAGAWRAAQEAAADLQACAAAAAASTCAATQDCALLPCVLPGACDTGCASNGTTSYPARANGTATDARIGNVFEFVAPVTGAAVPVDVHDYDGDGIPDLLDPVNLPSETLRTTSGADNLTLLDGLGEQGFVLLIEPGHREAQLVAADPLGVALSLLPVEVLDAATTLQLLGQTHGGHVADLLASALNENMTVNVTWVVPQLPTVVPLHWAGGAIPADGSWLMARSDPTRRVTLALSGLDVKLEAPSASHASTDPDLSYRWEFLNLWGKKGFCFDPTTYTGGTGQCEGKAEPGWLRAYSGRAHYALQAVAENLERGLSDLAATPAGTNGTALEPILAPTEGLRGDEVPADAIDLFDPSSLVHAIGDNSTSFPPGVGVDYQVPAREPRSLPRPAILQAPDALLTTDVDLSAYRPTRTFRFDAQFYETPGTPRDLQLLTLHITPADGNDAAQTFVLDGRAFTEYLRLLPGEQLALDIDADHLDGFVQVSKDVNADGWEDLVVQVPHFSTVTMDVHSDNSIAYPMWTMVKMTSATEGWLTGPYGAMYKYSAGRVYRHDIPGLAGQMRSIALHVVGPNDVWVAGDGDCNLADPSPFIAHYYYGSWSIFRTSQVGPGWACEGFITIWMDPTGSFGYAGGTDGMWFKYASGAWNPAPSPAPGACVRDIAFDSSGRGYVGANTDLCLASGRPAISYWDGSSWSSHSTYGSTEIWSVMDGSGQWAAAIPKDPATHGILQQSGSSWSLASVPVPAGHYYGMTRAPDSRLWFSATDRSNRGFLVERDPSGTWTTHWFQTRIGFLRDVSMSSSTAGLVVGDKNILAIQVSSAAAASADWIWDSLSPTSGTTSTTFAGRDSGTRDPDSGSGTVAHTWNWGDGSANDLAANADHVYQAPGTYAVTHQVRASSTGQANAHGWTVTVNPQSTSIGPSTSDSLPAGTRVAPKYYQYTNAASDGQAHDFRVVLGGAAGVKMTIRKGTGMGDFSAGGNWPNYGAAGRDLSGPIAYGQSITIRVEQDTSVSPYGGSYTLTVTQLPPPPNPALSSLVPQPMEALTRGYEELTFRVTWTDTQGYQPRDASGATSPPTITLDTNGDGALETYSMHLDRPLFTGSTYKAIYSYSTYLKEGSGTQPIYKAWDTQPYQQVATGAWIYARATVLKAYDFEADAVDRLPAGFANVPLAGHPVSYWHVTDTAKAGTPDRVAFGAHGKALWFGQESSGNYVDADGRAPGGALETPVHDLNRMDKPVLSFASLYETQDDGSSIDVKQVHIKARDPGGVWGGWVLLQAVHGPGFLPGRWNTVAASLADYAGKEVVLRFQFQADNANNGYLGWYVDDIVLGSDADGDLIPDLKEANRVIGLRNGAVGPVNVAPGQTGASYVNRVSTSGFQGVVAEAVLYSERPQDLRVELLVPPAGTLPGDFPALTTEFRPFKLNPAAAPATDTVCGVTSPVRNSLSPWYATYPNLLLDPATGFDNPRIGGGFGPDSRPTVVPIHALEFKRVDGVGLAIKADLTECLKAAGLSEFGVHDVVLRVQNTAASGTATIESFAVTGVGRSSMFSARSAAIGMGDYRASDGGWLGGGTPLGPDADWDGMARGEDGNDMVPTYVPLVFVDYNKPEEGLQFALDSKRVVLSVDILATTGTTTRDVATPVAQAYGEWRNYVLPASRFAGADSLRIVVSLAGGSVMTIEAAFKDRQPQLASLTESFLADPGNPSPEPGSHYLTDAERNLGYIMGGAKALYWVYKAGKLITGVGAAETALEGATLVVKTVGKWAIVKVAKEGLKSAYASSGELTIYEKTSRHNIYKGRTSRGDYPEVYDLLDEAITNAQGPYPTIGGNNVWFYEKAVDPSTGAIAKLYVLETRQDGDLFRGWGHSLASWGQMVSRPYTAGADANTVHATDVSDIQSIERLAKVAGPYPSFGSFLCAVTCYAEVDGDPGRVHLQAYGVNWDNRHDSKLDVDAGWVTAARYAAYRPNSWVPSINEGQRDLQLAGWIRSYRFIHDNGVHASASQDAKAFWGDDYASNPGCAAETTRRCQAPTATFDGHGVFAQGFTLRWTTSSSPTVLKTDKAASFGLYTNSDRGPWDGRSGIEKRRDTLATSLGTPGSGHDANLILALDASGATWEDDHYYPEYGPHTLEEFYDVP